MLFIGFASSLLQAFQQAVVLTCHAAAHLLHIKNKKEINSV